VGVALQRVAAPSQREQQSSARRLTIRPNIRGVRLARRRGGGAVAQRCVVLAGAGDDGKRNALFHSSAISASAARRSANRHDEQRQAS